jgi:DNA polymerase-1
MIALIDMDLVVYRCAASAEQDDFNIAVYRAEDLLDNILNSVGASEYRAFISSDTNFRKTIYPEYKGNRKAEKPVHLLALKEYALEYMNAEVCPDGLEADDMLGIKQDKVGWWSPHNGEERQYHTTICSLDKDLLQIPGNHYQWEIGTSTWSKPAMHLTQSNLEGYRLFYQQCIKGDPTDNIKGIKGKGKVFAEKVLANCQTEKEMFNVVRDLYSNDSEFIMNASCLWILREHGKPFTEIFKELDASV